MDHPVGPFYRVLWRNSLCGSKGTALLLFLLFGAVLALWLFGLLGLFGLPPASLYLSGVVGISLGFVIRSLARWKRKRTHGTDVS